MAVAVLLSCLLASSIHQCVCKKEMDGFKCI